MVVGDGKGSLNMVAVRWWMVVGVGRTVTGSELGWTGW
jgi:hypothetical protein